MSKPSWDGAPTWANYLTMDKDGLWVWHEEEPEPRSRDWDSNGRVYVARSDGTWLDSKEARP